MQIYKNKFKAHPGDWKAQSKLMCWYDAEGYKGDFEDSYSLALKTCKIRGLVHFSLAQSRFDLGRYKEAAIAYKLAIETGPDIHSAQLGLAACYVYLQQKGQAKRLFEKISESDDIYVLSELARKVWGYKYFNEALRILKKIVVLDPELSNAHFNLANAYSQNNNYNLARRAINKALKIDPNYQNAKDLLVDLNSKELLKYELKRRILNSC